MKTKNGFYRQVSTQIGSNDYVLLAGGGVEKFNTKTTKLTISSEATQEQWYRIAQTVSGIGNNIGTFQIIAQKSGHHTVFTANASISFDQNPNISILQCSQYINPAITQVRLVYNSSYQDNYAYLEVKLPSPASVTINITRFGFGWELLQSVTLGSIPTGYTSKELNVISNTLTSENLKATGDIYENNIKLSDKYSPKLKIVQSSNILEPNTVQIRTTNIGISEITPPALNQVATYVIITENCYCGAISSDIENIKWVDGSDPSGIGLNTEIVITGFNNDGDIFYRGTYACY